MAVNPWEWQVSPGHTIWSARSYDIDDLFPVDLEIQVDHIEG
jgi:hypothetical protein